MMNNLSNIEINYDKNKLNNSLVIRQLKDDEKYLWDSLVEALPTGCFMQSWAWADFKELEGYQTFKYGLFADHSLVGGCIFYFYPHGSQANLLIAPGAPILTPSYLESGMQLLVEQAGKLAKQLGIIALRIEPLWTKNSLIVYPILYVRL